MKEHVLQLHRYLFGEIIYSTTIMFVKTNVKQFSFVISDILTDMHVINVSLHKTITHIETAKFSTPAYSSSSSFYILLLVQTL